MDDRMNQKHSKERKAKITNFAQKIVANYGNSWGAEQCPSP